MSVRNDFLAPVDGLRGKAGVGNKSIRGRKNS